MPPVAEYVYGWRNNERRAQLFGRRCRLLATGRMSTVLVEFVDTGERVTTSRRALRRLSSEAGNGARHTLPLE